MIKISDLKEGDFVLVNNEGTTMEGEVIAVDNVQKMAQVSTGENNEFWYEADALSAIPLSDEALKKINFQREDQPDGSVKYMKGAFRVQIERPNDFSNINFWYREDKRHVNQSIALHQLQNYYLNMTKVHLTAEVI
ncbi:hypothetical protein IQ13_3785 [Lacibacter cauensis]|uniref:Uncharacterized protein n=1 Tax=Lacibacter cauensis TaxID=510947 RepID=A0A562SDL5_9BACT|nr:hypothetical protein [Lacibacter cauensis]TWI79381.1 hypothetical protein IQ13_3785 [Lacibacter cauensis]